MLGALWAPAASGERPRTTAQNVYPQRTRRSCLQISDTSRFKSRRCASMHRCLTDTLPVPYRHLTDPKGAFRSMFTRVLTDLTDPTPQGGGSSVRCTVSRSPNANPRGTASPRNSVMNQKCENQKLCSFVIALPHSASCIPCPGSAFRVHSPQLPAMNPL